MDTFDFKMMEKCIPTFLTFRFDFSQPLTSAKQNVFKKYKQKFNSHHLYLEQFVYYGARLIRMWWQFFRRIRTVLISKLFTLSSLFLICTTKLVIKCLWKIYVENYIRKTNARTMKTLSNLNFSICSTFYFIIFFSLKVWQPCNSERYQHSSRHHKIEDSQHESVL